MKNSFFTLIFAAFLLSPKFIYAQIEVPRPSPHATVSTVVGLTEIKIEYFRPQVRNRNIFGIGSDYLVPDGKIWRTGANSGTIISFTDDVKIQGSPVSKGQYLIFTWPAPHEWAISLYRDLSIGGNTAKYNKDNEVIRFKVQPERLTETVNTFTVNITDISEDSEHANVQIAWENTSVKFSVDVDYDSRVMEAIEATNFSANPDNYVIAARYFYNRNKHLDQALIWIDKYLAIEGKQNEFFNYYLKAQIQRGLYDKKGALKTAKQAMELAKKAPNDFGYIKRIEALLNTLK